MSTPSSVSLLMIGCGAFAHRYHVPALDQDPQVRIAGIFDPMPSTHTLALAARHGAPVVGRLEELPRPDGLAFALVTTPHTLHAQHIDALLQRGLHALVDKPFVMGAADAARLSRTASDQGLINGVAYNRRFDPGFLRAREIIRAGGIGAVRHVQTIQLGYERAGWFLVPELGGGGPYTGRLTHMADIVPWMLDRLPTRLRSRVRVTDPHRSDHGGFTEVMFDEIEWQATCIEEGWHMWDEVRLFGDDGLIELRRPLNLPIGWEMKWQSQRGAHCEVLQADAHPGDATRDFLAALRTSGRPAVTFSEAVSSVAMVELAFASAKEGGVWVDIPAQT